MSGVTNNPKDMNELYLPIPKAFMQNEIHLLLRLACLLHGKCELFILRHKKGKDSVII